MAQTDASTYGFALDVAQAGQLVDLGPKRVDSRAAEGDVGFGLGVIFGTDPEKQVEVPGAADLAAGIFAGIAIFTHTQSQGFNKAATPSSVAAEYKDGDTVSVLREGRVYVSTADQVALGDLAYVAADGAITDDDDGTIGPIGRFQGATGASGGLVALDVVREISAPAAT